MRPTLLELWHEVDAAFASMQFPGGDGLSEAIDWQVELQDQIYRRMSAEEQASIDDWLLALGWEQVS